MAGDDVTTACRRRRAFEKAGWKRAAEAAMEQAAAAAAAAGAVANSTDNLPLVRARCPRPRGRTGKQPLRCRGNEHRPPHGPQLQGGSCAAGGGSKSGGGRQITVHAANMDYAPTRWPSSHARCWR